MKAVVTMGQGGLDQLVYKDVPVPVLGAGEVLVRVLAAGMNNTDINTRMGWYADDVTASTADLAHQPLATQAVGGGGLETGDTVSVDSRNRLLRGRRGRRPR